MVPQVIQPPIHGIGLTEARLRICERPVFVIGAPRSGTTVLALSLARHSQLWTSDESQVLWDLFEGGRLEKNYQHRLVTMEAGCANKISRRKSFSPFWAWD